MTKLNSQDRLKLAAQFKLELDRLIEQIAERANSQFTYNLNTNIPAGILEPSEIVKNAVERGIISAVSSRNEFCIEPTLQFAGELLEDVNAHREAAELFAKAQKSLQVIHGHCASDEEIAEENALLAAQRN